MEDAAPCSGRDWPATWDQRMQALAAKLIVVEQQLEQAVLTEPERIPALRDARACLRGAW